MSDWIRYILARIGIMKYRVRLCVYNIEPDDNGTYRANGCIETNYPFPFGIFSDDDHVFFNCVAGHVRFDECGKWYSITKEGE